jgi:hypothetical protein
MPIDPSAELGAYKHHTGLARRKRSRRTGLALLLQQHFKSLTIRGGNFTDANALLHESRNQLQMIQIGLRILPSARR